MISPVIKNLRANRTRDLRSPDVIGELFMILMIVVIAIGAGTGSTLTVALGTTAFVVSGGGVLWSRLSLQEVQYRAEMSHTHAFTGDEIEIVMTVENRKPLPIPWIQIIEFVPSGLNPQEDERIKRRAYAGGSEIVETTSLAAYERIKFRHRVKATHRGHYNLGPTELRSGDLFGLFGSVGREPRSSHGITVYPKIVPLDGFQLPPARPIGDTLSRNTLIDDPSRPKSVREYRPGDPMKRIDWKLTAKQDDLRVRTFDQSVSNEIVIMLESATVDTAWHGYKYDVLEAAVIAAASIAARAEQLVYRIGFIGNGVRPGPGIMSVVPPGEGQSTLRTILEALAFVHPLSFLPLEKLILERGFKAVPPAASIVLVAGLLREGAVNYLIDAAARGHRTSIVWVGREDPPRVTGLDVIDMREQFKIDPQDEDFIEATQDAQYEQQFRDAQPADEYRRV